MEKNNQLKQQIEDFEREIAKLKSELATAGGVTLELANSTNPSATATAVREQTQQKVLRQPGLRGLKDAIADLEAEIAALEAD